MYNINYSGKTHSKERRLYHKGDEISIGVIFHEEGSSKEERIIVDTLTIIRICIDIYS